MLEAESSAPRIKKMFGSIPLARHFMLAALLSLTTFIGVSLSKYVNDPQYGSILTSSGVPLLVNELFFVSAAAVGASFSALFQLDREITSGTFVPRLRYSYWVRFVLGIVAGLLLATLLNIRSMAPQDDPSLARMNLTSAALALMGGFSSSVVQRVVHRLIEALETIVRGSGEQEIEARAQASKEKLEQALARERVRLSLVLTDLQRRFANGDAPESIQQLVQKVSREGAESVEGLLGQVKGGDVQ
jgi:hypothetical protein